MYATSAGKAILAYMTDDELQKYFQSVELEPLTKYTITDQKKLLKELKLIRSKGIAYSREESREGITVFGSPVFDINGIAVASIDVHVPTSRLTDEKEQKIEFVIRGLADELSRKLGFNGIPARLRN